VVDDFWLWSICKLILGCAVSARKAQQQASRGGWRGWHAMVKKSRTPKETPKV
jgi:hypothetical protein